MTITNVQSADAEAAAMQIPDGQAAVRPHARGDTVRAISGVVIGYFVGYGEGNAPLVNFDGKPRKSPVAAVCLVQLGSEHIGRQVALQFQQGDVSQPVILGLLHPSAVMARDEKPENVSQAWQAALGLVATDQEVLLTASRKLTLQCGAASISLDLDGNIEIRGENLLSRASRQNRIKGSSVSLN